MSSRRKNLLEAFQNASVSPSPPESAPAPAEAPVLEPSLPRGPIRLPGWVPWTLGVLVAFALGVAVGRKSAGEARAEQAGGSRAGNPGQPEPSPSRSPPRETPARSPQAAPATPARIEESPLFDPANRYTVVVATYSQSNRDFAWATYQHLRDQKLPVFQPVVSGDLILVLAGAASSSAELESLERRIEGLTRDGEEPYESAYRQAIDKLIPRTNKKGDSKER